VQPEIFQVGLEFLTQTFSQHDSLVIALGSSQMLFSAKAIEAHSLLKIFLAELRNDVESYETWGVDNDFSGADEFVQTRVQEVMNQLTNLCTHGDEVDSGIPNLENQTLFRNECVHSVMLKALEIEEPDSQSGAESRHLVAIKNLALKFLSRFVLPNTQNQQLIFRVGFQVVVDHLNSLEFSSLAFNVLAATFEHNTLLANTLQEKMLDFFATMIDTMHKQVHKQGNLSIQILCLFEKLMVVDCKVCVNAFAFVSVYVGIKFRKVGL